MYPRHAGTLTSYKVHAVVFSTLLPKTLLTSALEYGLLALFSVLGLLGTGSPELHALTAVGKPGCVHKCRDSKAGLLGSICSSGQGALLVGWRFCLFALPKVVFFLRLRASVSPVHLAQL